MANFRDTHLWITTNSANRFAPVVMPVTPADQAGVRGNRHALAGRCAR